MFMWKSVPDWEGFYEVSCDGQVRSVDRVVACLDNKRSPGVRRFSGRVLTVSSSGSGYAVVALSRPGEKAYRYVHDLVALVFIGPKPAGLEVCHNNGDPTDNRLKNLRYDTRSANSLDRRLHGTDRVLFGENASSAKLTDAAVVDIRRSYPRVSMRALGRHYGVCHKTVSAVINFESWTHIEDGT